MYEVECPYCENLNNVELEELPVYDDFDMKCNYCNEEFRVIIGFIPVLSSCKMSDLNK